ncbi:MAG: hypothetical protein LDL19_00870 [Thiobacillus sp.]|nr:hypothetical protein [Thiobacillus sp.]
MLLLLLAGGAGGARAAVPDFQTFPASGDRLLLWLSSERGRAAPEAAAAQRLAERGITVWSLDLAGAYFLPQLPSSMEAVPTQDMVDWLNAALDNGKLVAVYAVARAAVPLLRAVARLDAARRGRLCVVLMHPNLYASAEALSDASYLAPGRLDGLRVRVLQPQRSASTPWLPALLDHLASQGAAVSHAVLDNLREGYWARETPTEYEVAEGRRLDAMLMHELANWRCP